jgi:alpha-D-ribose 1-methylphosphonate 5-triphosphate synthase subunit PhnH
MALTLADHLTPLWLSDRLRPAKSFLIFHTACPLVKNPEEAILLLASSREELPELSTLNQGDPRYPDRSATAIVGADEDGPSVFFKAFGPGVFGEITFESRSLDNSFASEWSRNRASYPLGVDVFLVESTGLLGFPRSLSLVAKPHREDFYEQLTES